MIARHIEERAIIEPHTEDSLDPERERPHNGRRGSITAEHHIARRQIAPPLHSERRRHDIIEPLTLPHAGPSARDPKGPFLEAARHPVQIDEAGRHHVALGPVLFPQPRAREHLGRRIPDGLARHHAGTILGQRLNALDRVGR